MNNSPRAGEVDEPPQFSLEQVEYLRRVFPQRSPQRGECFDQLRWRGGECNVVAHIEALYKALNETNS